MPDLFAIIFNMEVTFDKTVRLFIDNNSNRNPQLIWEKEKLMEIAKNNPNFFTRHLPFYKCFVFVYNEYNNLVKSVCQFSTDDVGAFANHLKVNHLDKTFYACFYCYEKTSKLFDSAITLVRHMEKMHGARFFQCNNCPYRAISCEHVSLHQSMKHSTLNYKNCIIFCFKTPHLNKDVRLKDFYDQSRVPKTDTSFYQCLFCPTISILRSDLFAHFVDRHPDYPMLYYHKTVQEEIVQESIKETDSHHILKKFQKPSELIYEKEELYIENDDDDNLFSNDAVACFFCSESICSKLLKSHMCAHLFDDSKRELDRKSLDDAFFLDWMNNFINMQGAYFIEENGDGFFHNRCQICLKMSHENGDYTLFYSDLKSKYLLRAQKIHFINHSSFKPFKCLPCERNGQGHFWMPDEKNVILKHLVLCHHSLMINIGVLKELCLFKNLYVLPEQEWETVIKPLLSSENFVMEFSSQNEMLFKDWKDDNLLALKKLENKYYESVKKFNALISNYMT